MIQDAGLNKTMKSTNIRIDAREPYYKSPQVLEARINEYFTHGLRRVKRKDSKGKDYEIIDRPTFTGLCLFLGFNSRQTFYNYEKKELFAGVMKRARLMVESEYERQLYTANTSGAVFALKNLGWEDAKTLNTNRTDGTKIVIVHPDRNKTPNESKPKAVSKRIS